MLHKESSDSDQENAQKTAGIKFNRKHIKKEHRSKGFSLIELLVTVGIIGVLASVAIPAYNSYRKKAALGAAKSEIKNIQTAFDACMASGELLSTCATNDVNDTLSRKCSAAVPTKAAETDHNKCHHDAETNNTVQCWSLVKVSGSYVISKCVSYNASNSKWTTTEGEHEIGATYAAPKGLCKADSTCE